MSDRVSSAIHLVFHTALPILLVLVLLVGNALFSARSGLMH
jgi:hypothetical protein